MHNQTAILFFYKGKKMKLLSFAIPCYNSKDYMEHCIESILPGGDDVEIIIVDDGSKDETAAIADRYAAEYPDIVKAVHQENGGHGEAVNTGLKNATGKYFKVVDSDEHRLLMALRDSKLTDEEAVRMFFEKVIASYRPEGTYLILLANDTYDVPYRAKDGETLEDASENIYNYVLCTVCPVKQTKPVLGYDVPENTFHNRDIDWLVSAPQLGFLFPSFTDRSADIYSAMYYCRSASESYDEFIDAVFNREAPMPAEEQKTTFGTILGDALNDACSLDVVQTVHSRLCGMIEEHKASKDPEPLTITGRTMKTMLTACGVPGEKAEKFEKACAEQFGADAALSPRNLVETKKFEIETPEVQIRVDPEYSEWIETRYIDGAPYILIPAGAGVQVNGVPIAITRPDVEYEEEE